METVETFITFGVQYLENGRFPESRHPQGMHGKGYATIEAPSRDAARAIAYNLFGDKWAFDYDERPSHATYPAGEILRVSISTPEASSRLTLATSRDATEQEVNDLVFGTGALGYSWWRGANFVPGGYRFRFDRPDDEEGTFKGDRTVTHQQILDAASRYLAECGGGQDAAEMASLSIGYADAAAADTILQYAVLGEAIYG